MAAAAATDATERARGRDPACAPAAASAATAPVAREPTVARREGSMALVVAVAVAGARGEARSDFFFLLLGGVGCSGRVGTPTGSLYHIRSRRGERVVLAASR